VTVEPVEPQTSSVLIGQLAHELALLVRWDLEVTRCRRATERRERLLDVGQALAGAAAGLLALGAATAGAVLALSTAVRPWLAALLVAAGWAVAALLLMRAATVGPLLRRMAGDDDPEALALAEAERFAAETAIRVTARRLAAAAAAEAAAALADRAVDAVKREEEAVLAELLRLVTAPGRLGADVLGRLAASLTHSG
jgi:hypothetical protein